MSDETCIPFIQGIQYRTWNGPVSSTGPNYVGQPHVLSDPVPKGFVWIVLLMDAVASNNGTGTIGTTFTIEGYAIPPAQTPPRYSGGNNASDKTFFGDYQGQNDSPASPDANRPPIVDAIRTDQSFQGAQSLGAVAYHYGESKNLMPCNTPYLVLNEDWRLAAYTGIDSTALIGTIFKLRIMFVQLSKDQANQFLQRGMS